jgi:hypothetical protein
VYTPFELYISACFYIFTTITTVGYGDITPATNAEKVFSTFAMIVACGVFAYIVGIFGAIFEAEDSLTYDFK